MKIQIQIVVDDSSDPLVPTLVSLWNAMQEVSGIHFETIVFDNGLSPRQQSQLQELLQREMIAWHGYSLAVRRSPIRKSRGDAHRQCLKITDADADWIFSLSPSAILPRNFFQSLCACLARSLSQSTVWLQPVIDQKGRKYCGLRLSARGLWQPSERRESDYPCLENFLVRRAAAFRSFSLPGRMNLIHSGATKKVLDVTIFDPSVIFSVDRQLGALSFSRRMSAMGIDRVGLLEAPIWIAEAVSSVIREVVGGRSTSAVRQISALRRFTSYLSVATKRSRFSPDRDESSTEI